MSTLKQEIAAYENMREELEMEYAGKWVVFRGNKLVDNYDSFQLAAEDAVRRFGRGPYLIREVGAPPAVLPFVVQHGLNNATSN